MRDVGLTTGVKTLWEMDLLCDYTIKVQGWQFKAHKVVLASVSQYFKAMLGRAFVESKSDQVELKGLRADTVSNLLEFIYTREEQSITDNILDILRCAIYLQMPQIAECCVNKMVKDLNHKNCLNTLSVFMEYSFNEGIKKVKTFIHSNWRAVIECTNPADLSCDMIQFLLDYWQKPEWDMFLFIKDWYSGDPHNRKDLVNDVLSQVRFGLIGQNEVKSITEMEVFRYTNGPWHDLVTRAVEYSNLPVHRRVINQTEQSRVRKAPRPVFFTTGEWEEASTFFSLDTDSLWVTHEEEALHAPEFTEERPMGVAVNNFFVVCNRSEENQEWHIFDPRTLTWSQIASVARPKRDFAMVHHKGHLYVLGGTYINYSETEDYEVEEAHETDRYSFLTNEWTSILGVPHNMDNPTACVIGDIIYVCDWRTLYSLDLSSDDQGWEEKDSCLDNKVCEPMHVMTVNGEQVIVVIHLASAMSAYGDEIHIYSPAQNEWSMLEYPFTKKFDKVYRGDMTMMMPDGNSVYLLALHGYLGDLDDMEAQRDNDSWTMDVCVKWVIPETGNEMQEVILEDLPISEEGMWGTPVNTFGALLAIPPH